MEINERIKARRIELGLTLKDVADALNVAESTVSRYETSNIQNMGIDKIKSLADVLNCTPAYLMGWEQEEQFNAELGELLVAIRKTPMLIKLIQDFILLSDTQKVAVLNVMENFTPEKREELPLKYWEKLIRSEPQYFDKSIRVDLHPKSAAEPRKKPSKRPSLSHKDNPE